MSVYYYWYKYLPDNNTVDIKQYDIFAYFDALLYSKDRWSWMMDGEEYASDESGVVNGTYGAILRQPVEYYGDYDVKVAYIYPDSPFAKEGVTRGWTLTHINGTESMELIKAGTFNSAFAASPQSFTFTDLEGKEHSFTASQATSLNTRPGLVVDIFDSGDYAGLTSPVGYFNYLAFKSGTDSQGKNMIDDITEAAAKFKSSGIKDLILDLRYNTGGNSRASDTLVFLLAPESAKGKVFVQRKHNDILAKYDASTSVSRLAGSLDLERLYIITGSNTASASEMVLNGLNPLMDVQQVGDTTYGKPNGMYVLMYPADNSHMDEYNAENYANLEYVFLPICFYNMNGNGEEIPDSGIVPDNYRADDLYHDFGVEEDNISACLYHIVHGRYPEKASISQVPARSQNAEHYLLPKDKNDKKIGLYLEDRREEIPNFIK